MFRRRVIAPLAVVVAVLAGGVVGAVLGVPALSGAQESTTTQPATSPAGPHEGRGGGELAAAAKALDLTTQQLLDKLSDGKTTIADVAEQQHVDINTVIDAMAAADRQRIEDIVNNPLPKFGAPAWARARHAEGIRVRRSDGARQRGESTRHVARRVDRRVARRQDDRASRQGKVGSRRHRHRRDGRERATCASIKRRRTVTSPRSRPPPRRQR